MPLLDCRVLPFEANGKLYSARMYVSLYYMEVRLGQLKRKMWSDYVIRMIQGWLDGCSTLGLKMDFYRGT